MENAAERDTSNVSEVKIEYDDFGFVKKRLCPNCNSETLKLGHVDDIGTEWFRCEKCGQYCTKIKTRERKEFEEALVNAENAEVIYLSNLAVTPLFNGLSKKVHPAIDVINGLAVVGVTLPCITIDRHGKQAEKELPFFITSNREKILCNTEALSKLKLKLAYKVVVFENRWSLKGIQEFLSGKTLEPKTVYLMVKEAWRRYIEFDRSEYYDFLTLWTIGTYFFFLFNAYPYVYVGGLKQTGKTKVLTVASFMCFNAVFSNNMSTPSIYRLIQSGRCTLLMDETEKLSEKDRATELRNLLLSGYKKGAKVYRTEKTNRERLVPESFEVYGPKMIANIKGIEDVLEDRCITIIMKRGKNKDITHKEPRETDPIWQEIRDCLYTFFLKHFSVVCEISDVCVEGSYQIADRELELWRPIFTLAKFFDAHISDLNLLEKMQTLAKEKGIEKETENITETGEYILVQTLLKIVKEGNGERYYPVRNIKEAMAQAFDEEQKWLSTKWIGRALKRLGFTEKRRLGTGCEYKFTIKTVEDLAERLNIVTSESAEEKPSQTPVTQTSLTTQTTLAESLEQIKVWLIENKDKDGMVDAGALASKVKELGLDVQRVVQILKDEYWLREVPILGKFGVK
ncbi:MAG: hypothetical protein QXX51_08385 [Candidatus Bathyarchaeia archaeon]